MPVNLSTSWAEHELHPGEALLLQRLKDSMEQLRPVHPVSLLDLSPAGEIGSAMATALRHSRRKIRIMTYEWHKAKPRERRQGVPDVLVERGTLPGLHFSDGSFDYLIGIGVLSAVSDGICCRLLREVRRVALRNVILVEECRGAGAMRDIELRDLLMESGCPSGRIEVEQDHLCLTL